jgi:outer membrane protein assembly factor BamA
VIAAALLASTLTFLPAPDADHQQTAEVITEIRVHGNHVTPDDEVIKIAAVTIGAPFTATTIADITARLKDAKKFETIQVLKRFASIEDPSKIVVVIIVNEGAVRIEMGITGQPKVVKRTWWRNLMYLPILNGEDGYGFTYGVRVAYPGIAGKQSRLSFPLTWGGFKRAGVELDRTFARGPLTRIEFGTAIQSKHNPAFDDDDYRKRVWARAEKALGPVRFGGTGGWQRVEFGAGRDDFSSIGGDVTFDTRLDPVLPRNAVYASASIERLFFSSASSSPNKQIDRVRLDGRGYLGLIGQSVLVLRAVRENASDPQPPYLQSLLGGWSSLRGFAAGAFFGDTMVSGSMELRLPISSPLSFAKLGLSAFVDTGTTYGTGARFKDQDLHTGIGGAVWVTITAFRMGVSVAHGLGATTRANFGASLTF